MFSSNPAKTSRTISRRAILFTIPKLYRGEETHIGYKYYDAMTGKYKRFKIKMNHFKAKKSTYRKIEHYYQCFIKRTLLGMESVHYHIIFGFTFIYQIRQLLLRFYSTSRKTCKNETIETGFF